MNSNVVRIRNRRQELGMTQAQLAARAGVSRRTVQTAEAGERVRKDVLECIAEVLGLTASDLVQINPDDAIKEGPYSLYTFLRDKMRPSEEATCHSADDLDFAIGSIIDQWQSAFAFPTAINANLQEYYQSVWESNRISILFAMNRNTRIGVSVVVPVSKEEYFSLAKGKSNFWDLSKNPRPKESQFLLIDSVVPFTSQQTWFSITSSLRFALFFQVASLAAKSVKDLHIVCHAKSSSCTARLIANGFVRNGCSSRSWNLPIYELYNSSLHRNFEHQLAFNMEEQEFASGTGKHYIQAFKEHLSSG